ncbi:MAG: hypothetical protein A4E32_01263 [Methanomassiliicoccales archaeon PtaU1.Bin124]|nr:MAG: hypothetical protein A4E32_01263 [Methanomassiliicoccales archaeon PtaU1.Bin124]
MIRRSFIILPRVGKATELKMWRSGVACWDDFLAKDNIPGLSGDRKEGMNVALEDADRYLHAGRADYFTSLLPSVEQWRLFSRFGEDAAYLDIETDGLGSHAHTTMVSVHCKGSTRTLIRGIDLTGEALASALQGARMLVTYNGSSFDLPMLQKEFPFVVPRLPHFDLRHGAARVGMPGGLKRLEVEFGIRRPQEVAYVTGEDAVYLWKLWLKGRENALKLLMKYNQEDTVNLATLAPQIEAMLLRKVDDDIRRAGRGR